MQPLVQEFRRIRTDHRRALIARAARVTLGASVMRVFAKGTKEPLSKALIALPLHDLATKVRTDGQFARWYERALDSVHRVIMTRNAQNRRILPGSRWGHSAKVLSLFLREVFLCARWCDDAVASRVEKLLYVPIDNIVMKRMRQKGGIVKARSIKAISTRAQFQEMQDQLRTAARRAGVPAVWFDDAWAVRDAPAKG
jgi:hypothetical protein